MQSFVSRVLASLGLALLLLALAPSLSPAEPATPEPPKAVTDAIAASPTPSGPAQVVVGAYINDIQELDFKTNSYAIDLYVRFPIPVIRESNGYFRAHLMGTLEGG